MKFKEVPAPVFKRLFAFIIDLLVVDLVLLYPFSRVLSKTFKDKLTAGSIADLMAGQSYLVFSVTIIFILYFVLFEYKLGQTIGKMLVNLYCMPKEGKMSIWKALGRNLFLIPVMPFIFLWVIDPIFILWRNQSLSEMFTKTITIERKIMGWEKWMKQK